MDTNTLRALGALVCFGFAAPGLAQNRIFPTDVARSGEVDLTLGATYEETDQTLFGTQFEFEGLTEDLTLNVGLGAGLQLGARVPYVSQARFCVLNSCAHGEEDFGPLDVALKWRLPTGPENPFSMAAIVQWDTNTAADDTDGVEGALGIGLALGRAFRIYAGWRGVYPDDSALPDFHTATMGAYIGHSAVYVVPSVFYRWIDETPGVEDRTQYGGSLGLLIRLGRTVYLFPAIGYAEVDDYRFLGGTVETESWYGRVALNFLFGGQPDAQPADIGRFQPPPAEPEATAPPAPVSPATSMPPPPPEPAPPPEPEPEPQPEPLQPGMQVTADSPVTVYGRPVSGGNRKAVIDPGTAITLGTRIQNAAGVWWYVEAVRGWVRESDLTR